MSFLIKGATIVDGRGRRDADVLIEDGEVVAVEPGLAARDAEVLDGSDAVVAPGFVDLHAHLREPGREDEETVATGSAAAAAGGYTAVCAMPNTEPVADSVAVVEMVRARGVAAGLVDVVPAGALSKGLEGAEMAPYGMMFDSAARVRLFTDDGRGVQDPLFARRAMQYLSGLGAVYAEHCEDARLAEGGHMNEGARSERLGVRGAPGVAEEIMAARDIALARLTGCRLHLLHVSTAATVDLVRGAKDAGIPVTAEAAPHHFTLTDAELETYDPLMKVNPPLRSEEDRRAIVAGLADGTIDAIATDHAPHAIEEKEQELAYAPPGMIGLETAFALAVEELVRPGHLTIEDVVDRLSVRPAAILGLADHGRPIEPGSRANIVVFDPDATWTVDRSRFRSKSANSPYEGRSVHGRVLHTFLRGVATVRDGAVRERALA